MKPIHQCFILAAGKGERMRPLTDTTPKPLVCVHGKPLLEHLLDRIEQTPQIDEVIINAAHLGDQIAAFAAAQTRRFKITVSMEPEPLETGGGLSFAKPLIDQDAPLLCISGDSYWRDAPRLLTDLCAAYDSAKMDFLIGVQSIAEMTVTAGVGDYDLVDGRPVRNKSKSGTHIFTSLRVLSPALFWDKPATKWGQLTLMDACESATRLSAFEMHGWYHLTTPDDIARVNADV